MISQDMNLFLIFLSAMIVNNILLIRFLALCSFFGISNNIQTSVGMGMAVLFVMVMASSIAWVVYHFILIPFDLVYLRTAAFILTIATFVQLEEMAIRKMLPALYRAMGIYLPLIVVNCAVLGAAFLIIDYNLSFIESLVYTVGVAAGSAAMASSWRRPMRTPASSFPAPGTSTTLRSTLTGSARAPSPASTYQRFSRLSK